MQRNRLKQLLEQLEEVLAELKVEVYSDVDKYRDEDGYYVGEDDDDGYPDCCLLYTSPSPRDDPLSRMPSSA